MNKEILKIDIIENEIILKIKYDEIYISNIINFKIKKLDDNNFLIQSYNEYLDDNYNDNDNLILNEKELIYYINNLEI